MEPIKCSKIKKGSKDRDEQFLVSFSDVIHLWRRSKRKIFSWALTFGVLGALFAVFRPVRYQAEATFRERGVKSSNISPTSVVQLLSSGSLSGNESDAASLMISRRILQDVVEKLHLQAHLSALSERETYITHFKNNLKLVWASTFGRSPFPILKDLSCPLKIDKLQYTGEVPLFLMLNLKKEGHYEIRDLSNSQKVIGQGKLGELFQFKEFSIVLNATCPDIFPKSQPYLLNVTPLPDVVKQLRTVFEVEPTKLDKNLLKLKCQHRDRHVASNILNVTMESYRSFLKNCHHEIALNQLDYLNSRRDELTYNLTDLMQRHADSLSHDLHHSGFIDSHKEMDFLARSQHEYKQKLLDNELEIKRLKSIKPGFLVYYHRYSTNDGDPTIINNILSEIRSLKQQRDALEIELQKKFISQEINFQNSFEQQLEELKEVQGYLTEVKKVAEQVAQLRFESPSIAFTTSAPMVLAASKESSLSWQQSLVKFLTPAAIDVSYIPYRYSLDFLPPPRSKLFSDSRFLLREWFEHLQRVKSEGSAHWKETQANFQYYLNNLERLFGTHQRILQERLTHQYNPSEEYQAISLEVATNLYLDYSKQLVQMEGKVRQNLFFIHQIEDPDFEITSLSAGLEDPVSREMIQKASELILNLRDQNNQSLREQERLKRDLNLQRAFLNMHLKQMVQLMELNKQLLDEKIYVLQNVSLELLHRSISLLEKNLQDYVESRLTNLQQERILLQHHLDNIHAEMALLPQKWVYEQLLTQEVETNQRIVEEIVKLVESKNISSNLETIQSAPIDHAIPPLHPMPHRVLIWSILGFLLGGSLASGVVFGKSLKNGLNITGEMLSVMGLHVSGHLIRKNNLDTLRRLQTFFDSALPRKSGQLLLLLEGQGVDYASDLADLYVKRGKRVLILDLNFSKDSNHSEPGLLQYWHDEISIPPIQKSKQGDWIAAGGTTSFGPEFVHSLAFKNLINRLEQEYDWILAVSNVSPSSASAEAFLSLFSSVAVTIIHEKIDDLGFYIRFQEENPDHKISFLLQE